jgi:signal transduction histidine kinase
MFATTATLAPTVYAFGERVFSLSTAPIKGAAEDDEGEVVILHDLTAQQAVNQAKTDFIATISHELRTPLTSMCGYTDLLMTGLLGALNDQQRESLQTIRTQGQVMVDVLKNVILIASIDAGSTTPELQAQSVSGVLEGAMSTERRAIEQKGLTLQMKIPEDLPLVLIDAYHLKIALQQVFNNAHRYTQAGSIKIRALQDGDMVRIDVLDTGIGISPDDQKRLFMRFQRGGEQSGLTSVERGTGLGLSITRHLLEQIGGRISARSKVGVGSCFSLWVPAVSTTADSSQTKVDYAAATN